MSRAYREVFSLRVPAGSRTLFVDVKKMPDGSHFLSLSELTRAKHATEERARIVIDADYVDALQEALSAAAEYLAAVTPRPANTTSKREKGTVAEIRKRYPNAYKAWSPEDDQALRAAFEKGRGIRELARDFGRNAGAIRSRLRKLGLQDS
ncbi:MAG: DUF3276 family protein [Phycisphaerae bacterium]|nr:DUF3276 family protein [Phycisphaerae bacterium]